LDSEGKFLTENNSNREQSDDDLVSLIQYKRENKLYKGEGLDEGTFAFMHWLSNLAGIAEVTNPNVETDWQNMLARVPKNICDDCKANSSNHSYRVSKFSFVIRLIIP
jgi:hypothetical protein